MKAISKDGSNAAIFDFSALDFQVDGKPGQPLQRKDAEVLEDLVRNQARLVPQRSLIDRVYRGEASSEALYGAATAIRALIRPHREWLETVRSEGYKWTHPMEIVEDGDSGYLGQSPSRVGQLHTAGDVLARIQKGLAQARRIIVSHCNPDWILFLLGSFIMARARNAPVRVIRAHGTPGATRYRFLERLGCDVRTVNASDGDFHGVIFDDEVDGTAISLTQGERPYAGCIYSATDDPALLRTLRRCALGPTENWISKPAPRLVPVAQETLTELMQRVVPAYQSAEQLTLELVELEQLSLTQEEVDIYRVNQAEDLYRLFDKRLHPERGEPFSPLAVPIPRIGNSHMVPPVVERQDDGTLVAVDGHSRLYAARNRLGLRTVLCVVVSGVSLPLPGIVVGWSGVKPKSGGHWLEKKDDNARQIDTHMHAEIMDAIDAEA